jgi:eukaryotic-like serine/threonine-protein kinase
LQYARRWVELFEKMIHDHPEVAKYASWIQLTRGLADLCSLLPDEPFHDPALALKLARRANELMPEDGMVQQSLGWAQYRVGDWKGCIESLMKTDAPSNGSYVAAMAYLKLGEEAKARESFDRCDVWLKRYEELWNPGVYPSLFLMRQLRAEAAAMLGLHPSQGEAKSKRDPGPLRRPK